MASMLLSPNALACSAGLSSAAKAKSFLLQPLTAMISSKVSRWPEPGLPTFTRLPLRSSKLAICASRRAKMVNTSLWRENTARISSIAPSFSKGARPSIALYWWSDCITPKLNSPLRMPFTLATPPPLAGALHLMPVVLVSRFTKRQIDCPAT